MDVANIIKGIALTQLVPKPPLNLQGLLEVTEGPLIVTPVIVDDSDTIEGIALTSFVSDLPLNSQGLFIVA